MCSRKLAKLISEKLRIPTIGIGALAALQILALLIGIDVFGNGFSSLLHGRPARGTLVSFAALASLLHCASLLVFPDQARRRTVYGGFHPSALRRNA